VGLICRLQEGKDSLPEPLATNHDYLQSSTKKKSFFFLEGFVFIKKKIELQTNHSTFWDVTPN